MSAQLSRRPRVRLARIAVAAAAVTLAAPMMVPDVARATVEDQRREVERIVDELERLHEQADILAEDWAVAEDELTVWGMAHDGIDPDPFRLTGHAEPVTALAVRDGRIASGDEAGDVLLWPLGLLGEPLYLQVSGAVTALGWNPVEYRLSIGTRTGELLTVSDRR